jgi:hypothetical protein
MLSGIQIEEALPSDGLHFTEETHEYRWNGKVVPSVTTILGKVGIPDFSKIDVTKLEKAMAFGTEVHRNCHLSNMGELHKYEVDENVMAMVDQWKQIKGSLMNKNIKEQWSECQMYSERHGFAGTMDYAFHDGKVLTIVEIKTGITAVQAPLQTAAYAELLRENMPYLRSVRQVKRYSAHLLFGEFFGKIEEHSDPRDFNVFLSALNVYRWKNN